MMTNDNLTYDLFSGKELKQSGMKLASDSANQVHEGWSEKAYAMLVQFVRSGRGEFMCEDVRHYAKAYGLPDAPNNRAWGSIIACASKKEKIIKHAGYAQVKNPRAHRANASLWIGV